jgi:hypothetical protein
MGNLEMNISSLERFDHVGSERVERDCGSLPVLLRRCNKKEIRTEVDA